MDLEQPTAATKSKPSRDRVETRHVSHVPPRDGHVAASKRGSRGVTTWSRKNATLTRRNTRKDFLTRLDCGPAGTAGRNGNAGQAGKQVCRAVPHTRSDRQSLPRCSMVMLAFLAGCACSGLLPVGGLRFPCGPCVPWFQIEIFVTMIDSGR